MCCGLLFSVLTAADPQAPINQVAFHFRESEYRKQPPGSTTVTFHYAMDGSAMHANTDEAKAQISAQRQKQEALEERQKKLKAQAQAGGGDDAYEEMLQAGKAGKNQFNYSDRACQTFINTRKSRCISTEPPATKVFGNTVTQWDIYDSYMAEWERVQHEAALAKQKSSSHVRCRGPRCGGVVVVGHVPNNGALFCVVMWFLAWMHSATRTPRSLRQVW